MSHFSGAEFEPSDALYHPDVFRYDTTFVTEDPEALMERACGILGMSEDEVVVFTGHGEPVEEERVSDPVLDSWLTIQDMLENMDGFARLDLEGLLIDGEDRGGVA